MTEEKKQKKLEEIYEKYKDSLTSIEDLTAGEKPTDLFFTLTKVFGYLLENDPENAVSRFGLFMRKKLNPVIKKVGPKTLINEQVIENRKFLRSDGTIPASEFPEDDKIILPDEPVIWTANHAIKDDTLASILAMYRNAYILFGSLPQFYNTPDGLTAWLIGVTMTNRKVKESRHASTEKASKVLAMGTDMFIFPEGVWNKTPNQLLIDLWPGIYRIACETGAKVVPMAHYIKDAIQKSDSGEKIHTVIDDPIRVDDLSEKAALTYIRDAVATWYYLMMEKYGQSSREEALKGYDNAHESWEQQLRDRVATTGRYDTSIEHCADYRPKDIVRPEDVWASIANCGADDLTKQYAKDLVRTRNLENYQRRF